MQTHLLKKINRVIVRWAFRFSFLLAGVIPSSWLYGFVRWVVMTVIFRQRNRLVRNAYQSVEIAFGDQWPVDKKEALVKQTFEQLAYVIAESIHYIVREDDFNGWISISGEETLKARLNKGKGVIAVTAHLGNFQLMMGWFSRRGYKINVLMRPLRDPKMNDFVLEKFAPFGGNIIFTVPERVCVQKSIKALRANEILFILIDQNYGADARIFVDFFGKRAATGASPVAFARRTGAGVIPVFFTRKEGGGIHIQVKSEVELLPVGKDSNGLQENMQLLTGIVEDIIREYPQLWSWMHNRWKSRVAVSDKEIFQQQEQEEPAAV